MSKTTPAASASPVKSTRLQRGLALFRSGAVSRHGDLFVVRGNARNYTVSLDASGEPHCDCPDYRKRHAACKHGYAVVAFAAIESCRQRRAALDARHTGAVA